MDLRRLQVFAKVYECKSFSRAADDVLLSQPTVSGHIKSLEEEIGVPLFDRLGREILPTRAAELLYDYAVRILEMVEEAGAAVDAFLGRLRGSLVVGGSTIPAHYVLPEMVGRFRLLHPEVRVTVEVGDTGEIAQAVLSGKLEAGLVGAAPKDERLAATPIMDDTVCLAAWPDHPLAGRKVSLAEIAATPIVLREAGSGTRTFFENAISKAGLSLSDLMVGAQMGSSLAVLMAVRSQVGVGFISRRALMDDLAAGRLVELDVEGLDLKRQFYLITRRERTHSPAAKAFIGLCLAESPEETHQAA
jgi:DNA-binding transcriptional LysR family regulator